MRTNCLFQRHGWTDQWVLAYGKSTISTKCHLLNLVGEMIDFVYEQSATWKNSCKFSWDSKYGWCCGLAAAIDYLEAVEWMLLSITAELLPTSFPNQQWRAWKSMAPKIWRNALGWFPSTGGSASSWSYDCWIMRILPFGQATINAHPLIQYLERFSYCSS